MEAIIRSYVPCGGISGKILLRGAVISICSAAIALCAQGQSVEYRELMSTGEIAGARASVRGMEETALPDMVFPQIKIPSAEPVPAADSSAVSDMSAAPAVSVKPDIPSVPAVSDMSAEADVSVVPGAPAVPTTPVVPAVPAEPEAPAVPVIPDTPAEPEIPAGPVMLTVSAYGNGGTPELAESSCEWDAFSADSLTVPRRLGKLFDGWYEDEACTVPFGGIAEGQETLSLYAGWREFPGFVSNDSGYIIGCTGEPEAISGGLLIFPSCEECTGVESGALDSVSGLVTDIFIPANITYIAPGAFDGLTNLMFIEVLPGNPSYYSEGGILYNSDGSEAAYPAGRGQR